MSATPLMPRWAWLLLAGFTVTVFVGLPLGAWLALRCSRTVLEHLVPRVD